MNVLLRAGFGPADTAARTAAARRGADGRGSGSLGQAEMELAAKLTEALVAADAIGLTGIGLRLDQALVELTGVGLPIRGLGDDLLGH